MDPLIWQLLLQVVLVFLNAVFACAEIAILSINENKLAKKIEEKNKNALNLQKLISNPAKFLATIQVAITLSGFLGSAFAAENFSDRLVELFLKIDPNISVSLLDTICVIVITLLLSYLTLVFGELVPKRIAMKKADSLALKMSTPLYYVSKLFAPVVWILSFSTNIVLRLFGIDPKEKAEDLSEDDIKMMVDRGNIQGIIDNSEKEIIQNIFKFDDIKIKDIQTHRTQVSYLSINESLEEWEKIINGTNHSIYPIFNNDHDDVVGILRARDFFRYRHLSKKEIMDKAMDEVIFVVEAMTANILFNKMKEEKFYFAVVVDEYGGVSGIITMRDLLEELVGDIDEEN